VYAGYARYRKELLRGGVRLFELAPAALPPGASRDKDSDRAPGGSGGSSGASLHAKTFAVDRARIFVGSFNLDPRSARLNTEMGVVLESARLASALGDAFDREVPRKAYEAVLGARRRLGGMDRAHRGRRSPPHRHAGRGALARVLDGPARHPADRVAALKQKRPAGCYSQRARRRAFWARPGETRWSVPTRRFSHASPGSPQDRSDGRNCQWDLGPTASRLLSFTAHRQPATLEVGVHRRAPAGRCSDPRLLRAGRVE
jgi:hypothetical protein